MVANYLLYAMCRLCGVIWGEPLNKQKTATTKRRKNDGNKHCKVLIISNLVLKKEDSNEETIIYSVTSPLRSKKSHVFRYLIEHEQ